MMIYDATNWYWKIANVNGKVFSSATIAYVLDNDSTYVAWLRAGNLPTKIANAQELVDVLISQWLPQKLQDGIALESSSAPGLNGNYPLDPQAQQYLTAVSTSISAGKGLPGGANTFMYNGHPFTAQLFLNFATAAENYVYNINQALGQIVATGEGSIPSATIKLR